MLFLAADRILRRPWAPQHVEVQIRMAMEFADRVPEILEARGRSRGLFLLDSIAGIFLALGDLDRAQELWRKYQEWGERTRSPSWLRGISSTQALLATLDGRLEQAVASAHDIRALGEEAGAQLGATQHILQASTRPLIYLGRTDEALAAMERDPKQAEITAQLAAASAQVVCRAHMGLHSEAQTSLRLVMDEARLRQWVCKRRQAATISAVDSMAIPSAYCAPR